MTFRHTPDFRRPTWLLVALVLALEFMLIGVVLRGGYVFTAIAMFFVLEVVGGFGVTDLLAYLAKENSWGPNLLFAVDEKRRNAFEEREKQRLGPNRWRRLKREASQHAPKDVTASSL